MLGIVKSAVRIQRPVPAPWCFQTEQCTAGKIGGCMRLPALGREPYAVFSQHTLHFTQVCLTVIVKVLADIFGSCTQQHCQHRLTALQIGRFMDIIYVHISPSIIYWSWFSWLICHTNQNLSNMICHYISLILQLKLTTSGRGIKAWQFTSKSIIKSTSYFLPSMTIISGRGSDFQ